VDLGTGSGLDQGDDPPLQRNTDDQEVAGESDASLVTIAPPHRRGGRLVTVESPDLCALFRPHVLHVSR